MTHRLVDRCHPLHADAPYHHQHRQPPIGRRFPDEPHIKGCPEIKHHDGRNIPECTFIVQPEVPVDGDVANQINDTPRLPVETRNIIERCHDKPGREDTQQAALIELAERGCLHPREPQTIATDHHDFNILIYFPYLFKKII